MAKKKHPYNTSPTQTHRAATSPAHHVADAARPPEPVDGKDFLQEMMDAPNSRLIVFRAKRDARGHIVDFVFGAVSASTQKFYGGMSHHGRPLSEVFPETFAAQFEGMCHVVETGRSHHWENYAYTDGFNRWFCVTDAKFRDGILRVWEDISQQKETERQLHEKSLNLADTQSLGRIGNYSYDAHTQVLQWSNELYHIMGMAPGTPMDFAKGLSFYTYADKTRLMELSEITLRTGTGFETEATFVPMGTHRECTLFIRAEALRNTHGTIVGIKGIVQDITERKNTENKLALAQSRLALRQTEQALLASEEKYRTLFNSLAEGYCLMEPVWENGRMAELIFREVNTAFLRQTGLPAATGKTVGELLPHLKQYFMDIYTEVTKTGGTLRAEIYMHDTDRWYDAHYSTVGKTDGNLLAVTFEDMTERKRRELNLAFVAEAADILSRHSSPARIMQLLGEKIGHHLHLGFCHFMHINEERDEVRVLERWNAEGLHPLPDTLRLSEQVGDDFYAKARAGQTIVSNDTQTDPIAKGGANAQLGAAAFITVPFLQDGEWKYLFSVHDPQPREWRKDEIGLVRELANLIFPRLEHGRAEETLRLNRENHSRSLEHEVARRTHDLEENRLLLEAIAQTQTQSVNVLEAIYGPQGSLADMRWTFANTYTRNLIDGTDPVGRRMTEIAPGIAQTDLLPKLARVLQTGETLEQELFYDADGFSNWFRMVATRLGPHQLLVTGEEISSRKNAEETLNGKVKLLNEAEHLAHMGSWEWNIARNEIKWSDELYRIHDIHPNEATGSMYQDLRRYVHTADRKEFDRLISKALVDYRPFRLTYRICRPDGTVRHLKCKAVVATDAAGNAAYITGIAQDITEQLHMQEATAKAETGKRRAEQALQFKQQFLSNMSHEIRTPLTAILGFTDEMAKTPMRPDQHNYMQAIKTSGATLLMLVNDILDLAKVDSGKMTFEQKPFPLEASVRNTLQIFEPQIRQKGLSCSLHVDDSLPTLLVGDVSRLGQVLTNLLGNAVKFTHRGQITVQVNREDESDGLLHVSFTVTDTGIGIDPAAQEHIFGSFSQAQQGSHQYGGTGLGLSIVKGLVEAQGGSVRLWSEPGQGSRFGATIPFKKMPAETPHTHTSVPPPVAVQPQSLRILVA